MMNCWAGLRRRALGAVLGAASLLVGCGGGASREPFVPQRLIVLGDETSVLNSDGSKYSVNALNAVDNSLQDCQGNPLWVQILANAYSLPFSECQSGTATVSAGGLAMGVAGGSPVAITAKSDSISGVAVMSVTDAALVSIQVTPATKSIAEGTSQQFTATGTFTDSTTQDLTSEVAWTSSLPGTATVAAGGLATGIAAGGPVTITATSGSISGAASLTVTSATLVSIQVTPPTQSIAAGTTQQLTAMGTFTNATTQDLTSAVVWTSSAPGTAAVSTVGLARGVAAGAPVTITATSGSISGAASLTVNSATLVSIQVTPTTKTMAAGTTQQYTATGIYSDSTTKDLTAAVKWTSSATSRGPATAHIFANAGAQVSDIAAQVDRVGGFIDKDLVTVLAGANDIFAQYALIKSGSQVEGSCTSPPNPTCTGAMGVLHAAGQALAAQVNRIADLGGRVLISTVPELGLTPFALSEDALTPGSAAMLTRLTKEFNVGLRLRIVNDGRRIGLLLIDETVQAVVKTPASYGLVNVKDAVCIAGLAPTACTSLTLVTAPPLFPPASASNYLWANDRLFSSSGHALLGNLAYSRSSNNPF